MSSCRIMFLAFITATLLIHIAYAGPASRFALAAARVSNNKIPRSIRAPFRNSEMMTARGFGKRSQILKFSKDNDFQGSNQWNYGKRDTKFFDDITTEPDPVDQILNDQPIESFSVDWFANEMSSNPNVAKNILQRFVDTDHDGQLTAHELLASPVTPSQENENF